MHLNRFFVDKVAPGGQYSWSQDHPYSDTKHEEIQGSTLRTTAEEDYTGNSYVLQVMALLAPLPPSFSVKLHFQPLAIIVAPKL